MALYMSYIVYMYLSQTNNMRFPLLLYNIAYQVKTNTGADSSRCAVVRDYPESSELKYYEEIMYSQASDYLTPVSCGGPALNKKNYINLSGTGKGDTMNTIGEYQVMHPIQEVMSALTHVHVSTWCTANASRVFYKHILICKLMQVMS